MQNINKELIELLDKALLKSALTALQVVYCPGKNCGAGVIKGKKNCRVVECPECEHAFCTKCKEQHESGVRCKSFLASLGEKAKDNFMWKTSNTKLCPQCNTNIERSEGCDNMYCTNCRANFNWALAGKPTL